jgi:hypothetical protein
MPENPIQFFGILDDGDHLYQIYRNFPQNIFLALFTCLYLFYTKRGIKMKFLPLVLSLFFLFACSSTPTRTAQITLRKTGNVIEEIKDSKGELHVLGLYHSLSGYKELPFYLKRDKRLALDLQTYQNIYSSAVPLRLLLSQKISDSLMFNFKALGISARALDVANFSLKTLKDIESVLQNYKHNHIKTGDFLILLQILDYQVVSKPNSALLSATLSYNFQLVHKHSSRSFQLVLAGEGRALYPQRIPAYFKGTPDQFLLRERPGLFYHCVLDYQNQITNALKQ